MVLISEEANIIENWRMVHATKLYVDDCPQSFRLFCEWN